MKHFKNEIMITVDDVKNHQSSKVEKAKLISLNIETQLLKYNNLKKILEDIKIHAIKLNNMFSQSILDTNYEQINSIKLCQEILIKEGIKQFENDKIEKLGGGEWKDFITGREKVRLN